jgi:hypothetical protein
MVLIHTVPRMLGTATLRSRFRRLAPSPPPAQLQLIALACDIFAKLEETPGDEHEKPSHGVEHSPYTGEGTPSA